MKLQQVVQLRRRGVALLYVTVAVVAMCAVGSLALDFGRAELVKTELRRAADAAAFAALYEMQSGNGVTAAQNSAVSVAASNLADASAVVVDATNDVEFGSYDASTDTFTTLTGTARSSANAIHVTCRRTAARGTAVSLVLGPVIGINSVDVTADSVASLNTPSAYGIVGINSFSADSCDFDSYDSTAGAYGGANVHGNAAIASNGDLTFTNKCHVHSEAHPGVGGSLIKDGGTQINASTPYNSGTGYPILSPATAALTSSLYYPQVTVPTVYDNTNISSKLDASNNFSISGDYHMAAGTYVVNNLTTNGHKIIGDGAITLYVQGTLNFNHEVDAYLTDTHNLIIYVTGTGSVSVSNGHPLYASIYAPTSDVTLSPSAFYGEVIGKTLSISACTNVHYDESFANGTLGGPAKKKWIKHPRKWK